ncbi:MAG: response regulator, partial [Cyanobacteriota bacterium]|nr:response regulator [Cyanobacteriota bacterium]
GREALHLWQKWHPHLVFMDMQMPIVNGYQATQNIRAMEAQLTPQQPRIPIIALTASAFAEQQEECLAAGCDDFLGKPFRREEILEVLSLYLGVEYSSEPTSAQDTVSASSLPSPQLEKADLAIMSPEWIHQLHQAATIGSNFNCLNLIEQIPAEHSSLIGTLSELVDKFEFEVIISLTE